MKSNLIEPTLLFEFSIDLKSVRKNSPKVDLKGTKAKRTAKAIDKNRSDSSHATAILPFDWDLGDEHKIQHFAALTGYRTHSQVWCGWSSEGIFFKVKVDGKVNPPRFYGLGAGVSDGLRVWVDTRSSPGIHRATRFCHCFHFFPGQPLSQNNSIDVGHNNVDGTRAAGILDSIPRARDVPNPVNPSKLSVASVFHSGGYTLWSHIPADCLTGYSPEEFNGISLFYDVVDFEMGTQSMSLGPELRYVEDPSLWIRANLIA